MLLVPAISQELCTAQPGAAQHSTAQQCLTKRGKAQTARRNTTQHNTAQHGTSQRISSHLTTFWTNVCKDREPQICGILFSYLPNAQIWHWPELFPSACRPRSPALEAFSAQSLKSPQAIPSSSVSYGHHLQAQVFCPSAWTTRFTCKASICSTTLWSSVPAKPSTRSVRHDTQLLKPHRWVALST